MTYGTNTLQVNITHHSCSYLNISFFENLMLVYAHKTLIWIYWLALKFNKFENLLSEQNWFYSLMIVCSPEENPKY